MEHTSEKKEKVLEILRTKAGGNMTKCARMAGVDKRTVKKWKEEYEKSLPSETTEDLNGRIPDFSEIQTLIIKRVYSIVSSCNDPKKLMETYEALEKMKNASGQEKKSLFDMIQIHLCEKQ